MAASTGAMADAVLPEPVSPRTSAWRVSTSRGTLPEGPYSMCHWGMVSPGVAAGWAWCGSGTPTWSIRRSVRASGAEDSEVGLGKRLVHTGERLSVPAVRMKAGREHRVPLAYQCARSDAPLFGDVA